MVKNVVITKYDQKWHLHLHFMCITLDIKFFTLWQIGPDPNYYCLIQLNFAITDSLITDPCRLYLIPTKLLLFVKDLWYNIFSYYGLSHITDYLYATSSTNGLVYNGQCLPYNIYTQWIFTGWKCGINWVTIHTNTLRKLYWLQHSWASRLLDCWTSANNTQNIVKQLPYCRLLNGLRDYTFLLLHYTDQWQCPAEFTGHRVVHNWSKQKAHVQTKQWIFFTNSNTYTLYLYMYM